MTESTHNDKRHFSRIAIDGKVKVSCGKHQWESEILDISLKGALIQKPESGELSEEDACLLELVQESGEVMISMQGKIAHATGDHLGFHCESIDLDSVSHLKRMLELNLGDETLLQRELKELIAVND